MQLVMKTTEDIVRQLEQGEEIVFLPELSEWEEFQSKYDLLSKRLHYEFNPIWAWFRYAGCPANIDLYKTLQTQDEFMYTHVMLINVPDKLVTLSNFHLWDDFLMSDAEVLTDCIFEIENATQVQATFPTLKPEYVVQVTKIVKETSKNSVGYSKLTELYAELGI